MTCAFCGNAVPPRQRPGLARRFCSRECSARWWSREKSRRHADYAELERIGGAGLQVPWVRRAAWLAVRETER